MKRAEQILQTNILNAGILKSFPKHQFGLKQISEGFSVILKPELNHLGFMTTCTTSSKLIEIVAWIINFFLITFRLLIFELFLLVTLFSLVTVDIKNTIEK